MPSVVVIGARGYTGSELLPLLQRHPVFELAAVGSSSAAGERVADHVKEMGDSDLRFSNLDPGALAETRYDACVLALPNGVAGSYVEALDRAFPETVIVDLSADYRFDDRWVYGQPERFAASIRGARRIANPGCYATGAQLGLAPLVGELAGTPAVFGVSGFSGAGISPSRKNDPEVLADNLLPYSLAGHVHEREVSRHIGHDIRFLPHVAPFFRGISLTLAVETTGPQTTQDLLRRYAEFYRAHPLIEVQPGIPEVRDARGRHCVQIGGFTVDETAPTRIALVVTLDNLLKGAATQAVQNLNLAFGLDPLEGLGPTEGELA